MFGRVLHNIGVDSDHARPQRRISALSVIGLVLLLAGVGCLAWVGWQYFGTNVTSDRAFQQEASGLREQWAAPQKTKGGPSSAKQSTVPGDAIALLRIPAFGADYEVPILAGTDLSVLDRGVGHYDSTALPGEIGNFAIAGHRVTHGEPFKRLLELKKGDQIVVETRDHIYTYVLDSSPGKLTVKDTATWVLGPNPQHPDEPPTKALLTLTTCQDLFHSADRSVGFAHLERTADKPDNAN